MYSKPAEAKAACTGVSTAATAHHSCACAILAHRLVRTRDTKPLECRTLCQPNAAAAIVHSKAAAAGGSTAATVVT